MSPMRDPFWIVGCWTVISVAVLAATTCARRRSSRTRLAVFAWGFCAGVAAAVAWATFEAVATASDWQFAPQTLDGVVLGAALSLVEALGEPSPGVVEP